MRSAEDAPDLGRAGLLVYDGDCPFCIATSLWLVRRGLLPEARRRPFQAFEGEDEARLRDAGIHNEIALYDPDSLAVRTGADALLALLRASRWGWLGRLLDRRPLRGLLALGYGTLARNRRVIAPIEPARAAACDCDPDPHAGYRTAFVLVGVVVGVGAALLFGVAVAAGTGVAAPAAAAWLAGRAFALGWGPPALLALLLGGSRRGLLLAHVAWLSLVGGALLLLATGVMAALGLLLPTDARALLAIVGLVAAWLLVQGMAARRVTRVPVPWWGALGFAATTAGAIVWALLVWPPGA